MSDDNQRQEVPTSSDLSRHAATSDDTDYTLSVEEALGRYETAGLPRTARSIQRYCAKGDLDAHRIETPFGEKFLITPASVERHIAYIHEVRPVATSRDLPRHAAATVAAGNNDDQPGDGVPTSSDDRRQGPTSSDLSQLVATDTSVVALLKSENEFLRGQVAVKDDQIKDLTLRAGETNALINGLQRMLTPLLGRGAAPTEERVHTYTPDDGTGDNAPAT